MTDPGRAAAPLGRRALRVALAVGLVAFLTGGVSPAVGQQNPPVPTPDANLAINQPDQYAWQLLLQISQPANNGTNEVLWETWPEQSEVYNDDPNTRPQWPGTAARPRIPHPTNKLLAAGAGPRAAGTVPVPPSNDYVEEVKINRASFDFVVTNGLWYQSGLSSYLFRPGGTFQLPTASVTVKGEWLPIDDVDRSYAYHTCPNCFGSTKTYALVGLHVSSKVLPNWHWATFEHVANPGRCDYIGCHDAFGQIPPDVNPSSSPPPNLYTSDRASPALLTLMRAAGVGSEWGSYRLKGTQIDFVTSTGVPTRLGNSSIERGQVANSSCMTCHSQSALDPQGNVMLVPNPNNPRQPNTPDFFQQGNAPNGAPNTGPPQPTWFTQGTDTFAQTDFLWEFPFCVPLGPCQPPAGSPTARSTPAPTAAAQGGRVAVPSVVGMPEQQARAAIDAERLNNTYTNYQGPDDVPMAALQAVPIGNVLSQRPAPGTLVDPGTIVYLAVRKA